MSDKYNSNFPLTKYSLWDPKPIGPVIDCSLFKSCNIFVRISEKLMNILRFTLLQSNKSEVNIQFIAAIEFALDDNVIITIQRFHHIKNDDDAISKNYSDLYIHGKISNNLNSQLDENLYCLLLTKLKENISNNKLSFDITNYLNINIKMNLLPNESEEDLFNIQIAATFISNSFQVVPVKPLPFVSTALSNYLLTSNQNRQFININKHGFLSMDQARKLLLILESDPKALTLPLVGIWTCAVDDVEHPLVVANLIRYTYNSIFKNKVNQSMKSFLLVLFSSLCGAKFYQCSPECQENNDFQLLIANHFITINAFALNSNEIIEIELKSVDDAQMKIFDEAKKNFKNKSLTANNSFINIVNSASFQMNDKHSNKSNTVNSIDSAVAEKIYNKEQLNVNLNPNFNQINCNKYANDEDDITPRSLPSKCIIMQKSTEFQVLSSVPEVTLFDSFITEDLNVNNKTTNNHNNINIFENINKQINGNISENNLQINTLCTDNKNIKPINKSNISENNLNTNIVITNNKTIESKEQLVTSTIVDKPNAYNYTEKSYETKKKKVPTATLR